MVVHWPADTDELSFPVTAMGYDIYRRFIKLPLIPPPQIRQLFTTILCVCGCPVLVFKFHYKLIFNIRNGKKKKGNRLKNASL